MKPKLIIFDFDGTLCDTRKNIVIAFRATMERLGLPMRSEEACAATIGLTLFDGFKALYPEFDDAEAQHAVDTYRAIFAERRRELCQSYSLMSAKRLIPYIIMAICLLSPHRAFRIR